MTEGGGASGAGAASVGAAAGRVAVGHPIDVASGEFFATDIDHELSGVVPVSLGRTYNTKFLRPPTLASIGGATSKWEPFVWNATWLDFTQRLQRYPAWSHYFEAPDAVEHR